MGADSLVLLQWVFGGEVGRVNGLNGDWSWQT